MRSPLLPLTMLLASPALGAADYPALTRNAQAAIDSRDAGRISATFCADGQSMRPDGLISRPDRLASGPAAATAVRAAVDRQWGEFRIIGQGPATIVVAPTTVKGRYGTATSHVTMVWRDTPGGQPCLLFRQIAPGGDAGDAATWDTAFLVSESFSRKPNRLLTEAVDGVKPGAALDVGMGQGRNAVWLAKQGWQVTGFDVAGEGLRLAREQAAAEGVKIETVYAADRDFDFGQSRWDLIAFIYSPLRELETRAFTGLKPGGLVVAEAFGNAGDPSRASQGVFYGPGEMRAIFEKAGFKVIRYEEPMDTADYGLDRVPLVRLVAMKPER
jgi:SAM-dependent methyltransferase